MKVGVVGGGITGLACAYYLGRAGIEAVVFDPMPGGLIGSVEVEGCLLETGPESWLAAKPWAEKLIRDLGLGDEIVGSNDATRRTFVLRNGRFAILPEGLQMIAPTKVLPVLHTTLFSWRTKLRMGLELFHNPKTLPDRSVSAFVEDHFGREAVDYLVEPLLAGVYGGSPDELSAPGVLPKFVEYEQRVGSVVAGTLRDKRRTPGQPIFKSMRRGMGTLIDALREQVTIIPQKVDSIAPGWTIQAGGEFHHFDHVVLACRAAGLTRDLDPLLSELLAQVPYTGSSIWTFGFNRSDVKHKLDAFGFLIPKAERQAIMACTWVGTKWPDRVPKDKAVFRCFSTDPDAQREPVLQDLRRLMGMPQDGPEPIFELVHRWPETMPQYTVGHLARVAEIEVRKAEHSGLHLAGNAYRGIGIPDCILSARKAAEECL